MIGTVEQPSELVLWYYWVLRPMVYGCILVYLRGALPRAVLKDPLRVWITTNNNNMVWLTIYIHSQVFIKCTLYE